jgi:hypothetical protein
MGAADAAVLRKPDTAVGWKLGGLNLFDRACDQLTKFLTLLIGDRGL